MKNKPCIHFADHYLLQPTNPLIVNIIGAGGTGSQLVSALSRMHHSLLALGHPGLLIQLYDDDKVTTANLGRQLFATCDVGQYKAVVLINRINRFFGSAFKAIPYRYDPNNLYQLPQQGAANITISCVDTIESRFAIADLLKAQAQTHANSLYKPMYWMDLGNSRFTGQVVLSTVGRIQQPASKRFQTVETLPMVTDEYADLLRQSARRDNTPSCSLAEALNEQDLYVNSTLANMAASLLWNLVREGMIENRGFFLNLRNFRCEPIKVSAPTIHRSQNPLPIAA